MKRSRTPALWGILLVIVGVLILVQNLGYWGDLDGLVWAGAFALSGLIFVGMFLGNTENWWAIIPGFSLLGIGMLIGLEELFPSLNGDWSGAIFLGMVALAFWVILLRVREAWWAVIPAGVLTTLTAIVALDNMSSGDVTAGILFLGMGLTFVLVALLRGGSERRWALIPAAIMLLMSGIFMTNAVGLLGYVWPLVLVAAGAGFVFRSFISEPNRD